ncbi:MAG: asparagine--tRNA ligase [Bacteroidaceae bacterium]|nr:asparagine--tRNA ligase [Bacteroidaceae bacterium]
MKRTKVIDALKRTDFGSNITVMGWVRSKRGSKGIFFIALNDGSTIKNIQIVGEDQNFDEAMVKLITTGACIKVNGVLVESPAAGQASEVQAKEIEVLGTCDSTYPMQKKGQSFEYMRQHAHMRLRTNTFGAVMRIRHNMAMAIHTYFHEHGFFYFHTPLITASDCEGAGNMFQVTTKNLYDLKKDEQGKIIYDDDFFGEQTSLTVSGQLEGELGATALGAIYTFGPTFRAENSNTPRHLAEFWMIEPEVAFLDQEELMDLEEDFIKYCVRWALDHCQDDLAFLNQMIDKTLIERLQGVLKEEFVRLTYTEGINILQEAIKNGHKFEFPCQWGDDLASEHERYLVEEHFKKPVIMTDYPAAIKSFYMKQNTPVTVPEGSPEGSVGYRGCVAPGPTMQGTDVLFPSIGEIIGGSVREESLDKLQAEIQHRHMDTTHLEWYIDTRRWGTCPHAGFGLGFERLILFVTGMQNIRDVIPFPRTPKNAAF